jgi:Domain of unknown function (DUF397)
MMNVLWQASSYSFCNSNCVEVAELLDGMVGVRDSKNPDGPVLVFTRDDWRAFLSSSGGDRQGCILMSRADRIRAVATGLDYEAEALESLAWAGEHAGSGNEKRVALALADAQTWATLHLARCLGASAPAGGLPPAGSRGGAKK